MVIFVVAICCCFITFSNNLANYRPVTSLCYFSKVLEKLTLTRLRSSTFCPPSTVFAFSQHTDPVILLKQHF